MATSKEIKVGELLANSVEDHWFNPATLAHYLSNQPNWTIDRVMASREQSNFTNRII